jgi:hypothetical protein
MRKCIASFWLLLSVLTVLTSTAWAATITYTPPPQTGTVYTVINYKRVFGTAVDTSLSVVWGTFQRSGTISSPLGSCSQSIPAGFVLTLQHTKADSVPLTVSTDGTFVSGPYQGVAPPEINHPCYKVVNW